MEKFLKHGEMFNMFTSILQSVFKSYVNGRVTGYTYVRTLVFHKGRKYGGPQPTLYASLRGNTPKYDISNSHGSKYEDYSLLRYSAV
jgi:hypothetical protein